MLFRLGGGDAEVAHDRTLRWLARSERVPGLLPLLRLRYVIDAPREVFGLRFPTRSVSPPVWTRTAWLCGRGRRSGSVSWRSAPSRPVGATRQPSSAPVPAEELGSDHQPDGVQQRGGGGTRRPVFDRARCRRWPGPRTYRRQPRQVAYRLRSRRRLTITCLCLRLLYPHGDYFVVNVSSPNTPGLRTLQDGSHLAELLTEIRALSRDLSRGAPPKPLLVKVAPDLTDPALAEAVDVCLRHDVAGIVATNTTVERDGLHPRDRSLGGEAGGLSGRPLTGGPVRSVRFVHSETDGRLPVVGVGGILDVDDAARLFDAGASLVQVCTGLIYHGPRLVRANQPQPSAPDEPEPGRRDMPLPAMNGRRTPTSQPEPGGPATYFITTRRPHPITVVPRPSRGRSWRASAPG